MEYLMIIAENYVWSFIISWIGNKYRECNLVLVTDETVIKILLNWIKDLQGTSYSNIFEGLVQLWSRNREFIFASNIFWKEQMRMRKCASFLLQTRHGKCQEIVRFYLLVIVFHRYKTLYILQGIGIFHVIEIHLMCALRLKMWR